MVAQAREKPHMPWGSPMMTRTTQRLVAFRHPFALPEVEGLIPAGVYLTETDEELVDTLSRLAWRRVATTIQVRANGVTQVVPLGPLRLDEILLRDQP
jgi:hypothetical protein